MRLLTHEEALGTWCPFANMGTGNAALGNRELDGRPNKGSHCLGNRCAMWEEAHHGHRKVEAGYCGIRTQGNRA